MAAESSTSIQLESQDKEIVEISIEGAKQSKLLASMLATFGNVTTTIPIENVNSQTLKTIVKWCEHHKEDPIPDDHEMKVIKISEWDRDLLKNSNVSFDVMLVAVDYLGVSGLIHTICQGVADEVSGKTAEELGPMFGIPTNEELAQKKSGMA